MIQLRKPSNGTVQVFIAVCAKLEFTFSAAGATAGELPAGFVVDRVRIRLGEGEAAFLAAREALRRWEQFRLGWVEAWPGDTPLEAGRVVAVLARVCGLWWVNACRIVYVIDEQEEPVARFGFAYGTLPGHAASGEERFLIEWDRAEGSVWYSILAFSQPRHWLARLGYPLVRRVQRRFGRESAAAMVRAVAIARKR